MASSSWRLVLYSMYIASKMMLCFLSLLVFSIHGYVEGKECTNIPTQISSHTIRSQLKMDGWEGDVLSLYHSVTINKSTYMDLLPRKLLGRELSVESFDWAKLYQSLKSSDEVSKLQKGEIFLRDVSLHEVRLDPDSVHGQAQQTNLEYLLLLDVDRLVWSFRKLAGLSTPGTPYGGWEAPDVELRGHFVGQYCFPLILFFHFLYIGVGQC
ncbi:hypothetical protein AXF42_Ash015323 [Apostasia shenzhenica]|uniref:Non-reducing end beta-L-arabinofuranosidase-like GH127 catalytic domain-containing protein n=1 Tax=Apostasia shenzhenica TaxID=1088818 RepID=A0A2I0ALX3_9ASPA|nr:hypothetical protein AXF42_Ash015323 [Apostasia shenzhenica]